MTTIGHGPLAEVLDRRHLRLVLERAGIRPARRLGQHFLLDRAALARIIELAAVGPHEAAFEVGPGTGALTRLLAERAGRVVAVERDARFRPVLERTLAGCRNVRIVFADALAVDWGELLHPERRPVFAANLPYAIASPVLLRILEGDVRFRRAVVMIQREVAGRLVAKPGTRAYGALTVAVRARADVTLAFRVPRRCFWPVPEVDSAVVVIEPVERRLAAEPAEAVRVARAAFAVRRKTLANALARWLQRPRPEVERALERAGVDPGRRGETLTVEEFARVAATLAGEVGENGASGR